MSVRKPSNFSFIDEYVAGSAYIRNEEEVDWIYKKGVRVVISLVPLSESVTKRMRELGMENYTFEVEGFTAPPIETLAQVIDLIWNKIREGKKVLVHCLAGCGRTGTVLAAYLVSKGMMPDDAIEHLRSLRPCSIETQQQYDAVWFYYSYRFRGRIRSQSPRQEP